MDIEEEPSEKLMRDELCRLCANTVTQLISIFQGEGIEHNIAERIDKYLPIISVTQKDELPLKICYQCTSTLIAWHNFFEQCRSADDRLREIFPSNVKFDLDHESCHDDANDFHDDLEDVALFNDNAQVECVLIEPTDRNEKIPAVGDGQIPIVCDGKIPIVSGKQIPPGSDEPIPIVTDAQIPAVGDSVIPIVDDVRIPTSITSDYDPSDMSKDEIKSVIENRNDIRNVESAEEKWDPLTKIPQTHSARFVKSAKLGPLLRKFPASSRSCQSTKTPICAENSSDSKNCRLATKDESNSELRKRKFAPEKPKATNEEDSCSTKKRKRSVAQHDETDESASVSRCDSEEVNPEIIAAHPKSVSRCDSEEVNPGSSAAHPKSESSKKAGLRRVARNDEETSGDEPLTCAHCLRSFRRKSNLKRHMVKLHCATAKSAGNSKWFTGYCCDVCGEGLQHRATMMAHRDVLHAATHPPMEWIKYRTSLARVKFCADCNKYFRCGNAFLEHRCDGGAAMADAALAERIRCAEETRPKFACALCNDCFRWKWDYRLHVETEHGDAAPLDWTAVVGCALAHVCERCSKAYPAAEELVAHECAAEQALGAQAPVDETSKQYRCQLCDHEYFWKSDYRRHMRIKHPNDYCRPTEHDTIVYSCPYCADKFTLKKGVLQHMRREHDVNSESPFVCVRCNKVFQRRDALDRHNESHHPALPDAGEALRILGAAEIRVDGDLAYRCAVCSRHIGDSNRFLAHYLAHNAQSRRFKCELCDKQTRTQHQLNTHIKNIHLNIRNYRCDLCDKSFYTKQGCEEHRRTHTGERPYSCEICGKTFVAGNSLVSHKRFHNDFYPHACHLCDKKFKVRRSLTNHVRTHTGERPFACELCAKTFNNSSQYSYHKKITHSEERPFGCAVCASAFKTSKSLARHTELHNKTRAPTKARRKTRRKSVKKTESLVNADGAEIGRVTLEIREDENVVTAPSSDERADEYADNCAASATAPMTTLEYIQLANGEFKPVIAGKSLVALQSNCATKRVPRI